MINPKPKRLVDSLGRDEIFEPDTTRASVLDMVGSGKRVVEFGCGQGELSGLLAAAGNRVTGVETGSAIAVEARAQCEDVVVADLDARPLADLLPGRTFDVAVFADVLEYVRDPRLVLDGTRRLLGPGGFAVIAVPNVAHGSIRLALLRGRFEMQSAGPRERSALRFFTLKSLHELCYRAGYRVVAVERTKSPPSGLDGAAPLRAGEFERELLHEIETDPEHDTLHFIVRAAPLGDEERLATLVDAAIDAELRANDSRAALARSEQYAATMERRAAELEERVFAESAERALAEAELANLRALLERAAEHERAGETLRARTAELGVEAAALRAALEDAREEAAVSREAVVRAQAAFDAETARLCDDVAAWRERVTVVRAIADEANRERDDARTAREAADARGRELEAQVRAAQALGQSRLELIEDLRFEVERVAAELRTELAERERFRKTQAVLESAAAAFFSHVEAELARTRGEIAQIDGMIAQVQSSRWWTIKRALGKAARVVAAKVRR